MSGQPAVHSEASPPRILVACGDAEHELFDVLDLSGDILRVRSAFLFELGEELTVRLEQDGRTSEVRVRVRAHTGPDDARLTELEIADRAPEPP
ncbi:MAG: hypothetical protein E6J90_05880 [Deltaproteobacteria bacterium]|nr:MAG: hypothetical protein E6J91_06900 [Deltaproteobacteria bacterium]TMQ25489.1 MAG: hypothetical protein E6J90_05880 [Deltaproteobacteria bacterium]